MSDRPIRGSTADLRPATYEDYLDAQARLVELMWADDGTPEAAERQQLIACCRAFEREVLGKHNGAGPGVDDDPAATPLGSVRLVLPLPPRLRIRLRLKALREGRAVGEIVEDAIREALARAHPSPPSEAPVDDTGPAPPLRLVLPGPGRPRSRS